MEGPKNEVLAGNNNFFKQKIDSYEVNNPIFKETPFQLCVPMNLNQSWKTLEAAKANTLPFLTSMLKYTSISKNSEKILLGTQVNTQYRFIYFSQQVSDPNFLLTWPSAFGRDKKNFFRLNQQTI